MPQTKDPLTGIRKIILRFAYFLGVSGPLVVSILIMLGAYLSVRSGNYLNPVSMNLFLLAEVAIYCTLMAYSSKILDPSILTITRRIRGWHSFSSYMTIQLMVLLVLIFGLLAAGGFPDAPRYTLVRGIVSFGLALGVLIPAYIGDSDLRRRPFDEQFLKWVILTIVADFALIVPFVSL